MLVVPTQRLHKRSWLVGCMPLSSLSRARSEALLCTIETWQSSPVQRLGRLAALGFKFQLTFFHLSLSLCLSMCFLGVLMKPNELPKLLFQDSLISSIYWTTTAWCCGHFCGGCVNTVLLYYVLQCLRSTCLSLKRDPYIITGTFWPCLKPFNSRSFAQWRLCVWMHWMHWSQLNQLGT